MDCGVRWRFGLFCPVTTYILLVIAAAVIHDAFGTNYNLRRWERQSCGKDSFKCNSGECVDTFLTCDGIRNCDDGSDETFETCGNVKCQGTAFRCDYGACVRRTKVCDGVKQCADGSDENEKQCGRVKSIQRRSTGCTLPSQPENGEYKLAGCNPPSWKICTHQPDPGNTVRNGFISYKCNSGFVLSGEKILFCFEKWSSSFPNCSRVTTPASSGCTLPEQPENGQYALGGCNPPACKIVPGTTVETAFLRYTCNLGFVLSGSENVLCDGGWSSPFPTCSRASSSGCTLPPQPENGQYKLGGCNPPACQLVPGNTVQFAYVKYTCNPDFKLSGSEILVCDGGWSSSFPTCSQAMCPPLVDPTREIECKQNDVKVDCYKPMALGAKATAECKTYYTNTREFSDFNTVCQADGAWTRPVTSCIPKCGEPNVQGVPLISHGVDTKYGEFPWHAGIYRLIDGTYKQVCGGSIISEEVILTAAHCFWDNLKDEAADIKRYKVAVGKYYIDWNNPKEHFVQKREIKRIILHERFRGGQRRWQDDVAIIILKDRIVMTVAVRPICVDFGKEYEKLFVPGKIGVIVGWGITEAMNQSDTLRSAALPYVQFADCEKQVPQSFVEFLSSDKFCAGYRNGTSVCPGDNGGGYATQFRDGRWYLMGIQSIGIASTGISQCAIDQYSIFSHLPPYYDFIRSFINY